MLKKSTLSLFALIAGTVACGSIESGDLRTNGMRPHIEVKARQDGSATDIIASIGAGGALTTVDLDGDDVLSASAGDVSVELSENSVLQVFTYTGTLQGIGEPGTEVTVSLTRGEQDESAPNNTVVLPVPIAIAAPAAGTAFSRVGDVITVEITSAESTDPVTLDWSGECVDAGSLNVPAGQASVAINADTIKKRAQVDENDPDSEPVPDTCTVSLRLVRRIGGTIDPAFGGGEIFSTSIATRDITSNP